MSRRRRRTLGVVTAGAPDVDEGDVVDRIAAQWAAARPDVDSSPLTVVGRVSRLSRRIDQRLAANFARHGLEAWHYDVLATLRRGGPPYRLTAGQLGAQMMVTTGAVTNRLDRLEERGWVRRSPGADRRTVVVTLTDAGRVLVDKVVGPHQAVEAELLGALTAPERDELARLLRTVLLSLGDRPTPPAPAHPLG